MNLTLKRTPGIYVVGFMGAGKSTVGRHLAHRVGWSFFDTVQRRVSQATHRPLARDPEAFAALYHARRDHYRLADVHVPVHSDDPEITVAAILAHPLFK